MRRGEEEQGEDSHVIQLKSLNQSVIAKTFKDE
jgi:hypothetical protein